MTGRRRPASNPFDRDENQNPDFSLFDADAAIFGEIAAVDAERQVAEPVGIFDILPDPAQPRRAVPTTVRQFWDGRPETVQALFSAWLEIANRERQVLRQEPVDLEAYLLGEDTPRSEIADDAQPVSALSSPAESALLQVAELAASIRRDGLTNPITVVHAGNKYRLETGERRWLAYHMLYLWFGEPEHDKWGKIPARVMDRASVWRQASENNARANLNAIAKARQFAILLMDVYRHLGQTFETYETVVTPDVSDRLYYAQVADGKRYDIPRGSGEKFVNAMGMKDASQVRQLRQLLRLPDVVWGWADDLDWTVGRLRGLLNHASSDDELIWLAARQAEHDGLSVSIDTPPPPPKQSSKPTPEPGSPKHFARFARLLEDTGQDKVRQNQRALDMLLEHKAWLEEQEAQLRDWLE